MPAGPRKARSPTPPQLEKRNAHNSSPEKEAIKFRECVSRERPGLKTMAVSGSACDEREGGEGRGEGNEWEE